MPPGFPSYLQADTQGVNYGLTNQLSPEAALQEQALNRRRHLANLMTQQGMQPLGGKMVGRFYVADSPVQGLSNLAKVGAGTFLSSQADKEQKGIAKKDAEDAAEYVREWKRKRQMMEDLKQAPVGVPTGPVPNGEALPPPQAESAQPMPPFHGIAPQGPYNGQVGAAPVPSPSVQSAAPPIPAQRPASQAGVEGMQGLDMENMQPADMSQAAQPPQPSSQPAPSPMPASAPPVPSAPPPAAAQPRQTTMDDLADLLTHQHPMVRQYGAMLAQQMQKQQEREAQQGFMAEQRAMDRDVRREGIEANAATRAEMMRNTMAMKEMQLAQMERDSLRDAKSQEAANALRADIAKGNQELQRLNAQTASQDRRYQSDTMKTIAGMNQQAKQDAKDEKQRVAMETDRTALETINSSLDGLIKNATALKNHPGMGRITGLMGALPNMPGSDASNAQALLESLRSKTAVGAIQDMRSMSKTGGAVGQVTEKEWPRLENLYQALNTAQSPAAFSQALDELVSYAQESKGRIQGGFDRKYGNAGTAQTAAGAPQVGAVEDGYRFKGGNPSDPKSWEKVN